MAELKTLMTGLMIGESARWHDGRLWFSNWGSQQIMAVDLNGNSQVMAKVPTTIPFSIDWLPDGRLLVVSGPEAKLLRQEPDGSLVTHADLSGLAKSFNEIVVDGRGNIYVNGSDFEFRAGGPFIPGIVALVRPDGSVRQVADDIHFPNGMLVTPDNATLVVAESFKGHLTAFDIGADGTLSDRRIWAELGPAGGDGLTLDAEGAIWTGAMMDNKGVCIRVAEGGRVLERFDLEPPRGCFSCALGGDDGKTLFMMVAEWRGVENMEQLLRDRTGQVLTTPAPAPHAGWP
ncbi:MAG TPA: SMP-30/gluconolactonase/LRE family protein [Chloroflexota bacterium]